ncbi:MAG: universal stress protein [Pseudomonadota bacterium]|jgi:nucleotide-binding universal stress UspA family protein
MTDITPNIGSILLTTDLSPDAASAYGMARSLMRAYNCHLTLLCCIDTSPQFSEASFGSLESLGLISAETMKDNLANVERALKDCIATHFDPARSAYRVVDAPIPVKHSIVTFVQQMEPDMVIISSHGRSGVSRALMGSVAEHVLRHCGRPVLVVPAQPR